MDKKATTRSSAHYIFRCTVSALALCLAAGCGQDREPRAAATSSGMPGPAVQPRVPLERAPHAPGTPLDDPDYDGSGSRRLIVDPSRQGQGRELRLAALAWGRLADVYSRETDGRRLRIHRDFVIGSDIESDGVDFLLEESPTTVQTKLSILHPLDSAEYETAFRRIDRNLTPISDPGADPGSGPFSAVPRNAAVLLRFDDLLDHDLVSERTVRSLVGYPPDAPFTARVVVDRNHGDVVRLLGDDRPRLYTTRVIVDTTVTDFEAVEGERPLPLNGVGFPEATRAAQANVALRLPTVERPDLGQTEILRNPTGAALATTGDGTVDFGSPTVDLLRLWRSGGAATGDPYAGFLRDDDPPVLVARQVLAIQRTPVRDPAGDLRDFVLPTSRFASAACATSPRAGDLVRQPGVFAEVLQGAALAADGTVSGLRVRLLAGDPEEWLGSAVGEAIYHAPFGAGAPGACAVRVLPEPGGFPDSPTADLATGSTVGVLFGEALDAATVDVETLGLSRAADPADGTERVVGSIRSGPDAREFFFAPDLPLAHAKGVAESYFLQLVAGGPRDLAGNRLASGLEAVELSIDADAPTERNSGRLLRFSSFDEEPPLGGYEWTGQHVIEEGRIRPRPLVRFEAVADRTQAIPRLHTPFPAGVQTPLAALGSKLQTVWRYADVGFSLTDESSVNVDVEGLNWSSPTGAFIADRFDEFEIRLAHSSYLPDELIDSLSLFPLFPSSGLRECYDDNLFDPENDPQAIVHPRQLGYTVSPGDAFESATGTVMMPYPLNRDVPARDFRYYTWRDTALLNRAAPLGGGVELNVNCRWLGIGTCGLMVSGNVETIGLPLLMEFRCYPDDGALGLNVFDVSLAANSSARPDFRAFSSGGFDSTGMPVIVDPDLEECANGGFNPHSTPPGGRTYGRDNTLYIGSMDLVTRVSRSYSIWFDADGSASPDYRSVLASPRPDGQPTDTAVQIALRGAGAVGFPLAAQDARALDVYGDFYFSPSEDRNSPNPGFVFHPDAKWHADVDAIDGAAYYQIRLTFLADPVTGAVPGLASLGIDWTE